MAKKKLATVTTDPSQLRRLARKDVLLSGLLADTTGQTAMECTIRDIHAEGAAVSPGLALRRGGQVYLVDVGNQTAHLARVAWTKDDRSGLQFVQSFSMGFGLPPRLAFLRRHLFQAKLRQAERAIASGASARLAFGSIGMTREYLLQMERHAATDAKFRKLLQTAERLMDE